MKVFLKKVHTILFVTCLCNVLIIDSRYGPLPAACPAVLNKFSCKSFKTLGLDVEHCFCAGNATECLSTINCAKEKKHKRSPSEKVCQQVKKTSYFRLFALALIVWEVFCKKKSLPSDVKEELVLKAVQQTDDKLYGKAWVNHCKEFVLTEQKEDEKKQKLAAKNRIKYLFSSRYPYLLTNKFLRLNNQVDLSRSVRNLSSDASVQVDEDKKSDSHLAAITSHTKKHAVDKRRQAFVWKGRKRTRDRSRKAWHYNVHMHNHVCQFDPRIVLAYLFRQFEQAGRSSSGTSATQDSMNMQGVERNAGSNSSMSTRQLSRRVHEGPQFNQSFYIDPCYVRMLRMYWMSRRERDHSDLGDRSEKQLVVRSDRRSQHSGRRGGAHSTDEDHTSETVNTHRNDSGIRNRRRGTTESQTVQIVKKLTGNPGEITIEHALGTMRQLMRNCHSNGCCTDRERAQYTQQVKCFDTYYNAIISSAFLNDNEKSRLHDYKSAMDRLNKDRQRK